MREKEQEREKKKDKERKRDGGPGHQEYSTYKFSEHNEWWSGLFIINRLFTPSHLLN